MISKQWKLDSSLTRTSSMDELTKNIAIINVGRILIIQDEKKTL